MINDYLGSILYCYQSPKPDMTRIYGIMIVQSDMVYCEYYEKQIYCVVWSQHKTVLQILGFKDQQAHHRCALGVPSGFEIHLGCDSSAVLLTVTRFFYISKFTCPANTDNQLTPRNVSLHVPWVQLTQTVCISNNRWLSRALMFRFRISFYQYSWCSSQISQWVKRINKSTRV